MPASRAAWMVAMLSWRSAGPYTCPCSRGRWRKQWDRWSRDGDIAFPYPPDREPDFETGFTSPVTDLTLAGATYETRADADPFSRARRSRNSCIATQRTLTRHDSAVSYSRLTGTGTLWTGSPFHVLTNLEQTPTENLRRFMSSKAPPSSCRRRS